MMRCAVTVRDATPQDADVLLELWAQTGHPRTDAPPPVADVAASLARVAASADERLLVAEVDGRAVGMMSMARVVISPLHAEPVVQTSFLVVDPSARKLGVGRALIETAVEWAEDKDVTHLTTISSSGAREVNRWLARLGFSTLAGVRIAPTATVRRQLTPEVIRGKNGSRKLGRLLAERRSQRQAEVGSNEG